SSMKKVRLVAHQACQKKLVSDLQEWRLVQIVDIRKGIDDSEFAAEFDTAEIDLDQSSAAESQAHIKATMDYLRRFNTKSESLIESFMNLKKKLTRKEMDEIIHHYNGLEVASRCNRYDKRLSEITTLLSHLTGEKTQLELWKDLDFAPDQLKDLTVAEAAIGTIQLTQLQTFLHQFSENTQQMTHVEQLSQTKREVRLLVLSLKDDQNAKEYLRESDFTPVNLPHPELIPTQALNEIENEKQKLVEERETITADSIKLLEDQTKLEALHDYFGQQLQKHQTHSLMLSTNTVFLLEGWVEEIRSQDLTQRLAEHYPDAALFLDDPLASDEPPIVLHNNEASTPFEFVMNVYGWPNYREVDPSAVLAPFFALFFSIALGDAGYGLILVLACLYFMRKYDLDAGGKKFFRLFMTCGAVTMVVGLLLNGFFGNFLDAFPLPFLTNIKNSLVMIDPMKNPLGVMALSVALGVIHVWTGYLVKSVGAWRRGDKIGAILDSGPWLIWIASLAFFALTMLIAPLKGMADFGKYFLFAGAAGIILTQGRSSGSIIGKFGGGLYALYNTIGTFSDTLSYTRLLALGLSSSVIAMVINTFAAMLTGIPFIGWFLTIALLVFGHLFNLVLSLLSSFIHSARLQYVEFFTKFFEGGGVPFRPFGKETKYTMIKE
ncbi:MAG TPA: V-type ATP synthase subunit I, partial [Bacillota bacterium]|nr:V-type ATP synthase subunit I [Bacillota bacterium]